MKCEQVSNELIAYIDGRTTVGVRRGIEAHLSECAACRTRADELRNVWTALDEVPAVEPSFGFDARLRQQIAAEPARRRFLWLVPQPRLALSMALLAAMMVLAVKLPLEHPVAQQSAAAQQEDFNAIKNLNVLENYDVVTKLGALSDLVPAQVNDAVPPLDGTQEKQDQQQNDSGNGGV